MKCTEAPVRRATALSKRWFPLIHLFVVVYACLLQSRDCVSIATRVWVIICVTTFIPLRKGEGEVRLSSLSKEGAKGRRKDRQKGSGREAQARKIGKNNGCAGIGFALFLPFVFYLLLSVPGSISRREAKRQKSFHCNTFFVLLSD